MISIQKKAFLEAKMLYNYMYILYNTKDNYLEKTINEAIEQYDKYLLDLSKYNSSTLEYVYLLYMKLASSIDKSINANLRSILLKFDIRTKTGSTNTTLLGKLPKRIRYLLSIQLNNYSEELELNILNEQFKNLETILDVNNTVYYDLGNIFKICDTLNYVLELLYEPKKWYNDNKMYLNSPSGLVIKQFFYDYFIDITNNETSSN